MSAGRCWLKEWGGRAWIRCGSNGVNYQAVELFHQLVNCDPRHLHPARGYISFRPSSSVSRLRLNDLWENVHCPVWGFHHHCYADALIIGRKQFAWVHWQLRLPQAGSGQETWEHFQINERHAAAGGDRSLSLFVSHLNPLKPPSESISRSPG